MKKSFFTALLLINLVAVSAQVDSSYYAAKYPTGQEGFIRDMEAFARITNLEKDTITRNDIKVTLRILESGEVAEVSVLGDLNHSLKQRIEAAAEKIYHFVPATRNGLAVESDFNTTLSYDLFLYRRMWNEDLSLYEESKLAWSMDIGGYVGGFEGEVSKVYGLNGGMVFGMGAVCNNYIINFDFGLGGAKKYSDFDFPPEVISESNNVHFYYGISLSKIIDVKPNQSIRTKIGVGGYSINAGLISESNLYRLNGLDIYGELAYAYEFADVKAYGYSKITKSKHYLTPFIQVHSWHGDEQSKGLLFSGGVKYSFESYGMVKKSNSDW